MKKATFVEIAPNGRGIGMRFRLEPAHNGAVNALLSVAGGETAVFAADGDWTPVPAGEAGDGLLFEAPGAVGAAEAFASLGYEAAGTPAPVVRKVTMVWTQAGTAADSREAIVNRCLTGRDVPEVKIEQVG